MASAHVSADDPSEAPASRVIGTLTLVIVVIAFTGVVLMDAQSLLQTLLVLRHNLMSRFSQEQTIIPEVEPEIDMLEDVLNRDRPTYYRNSVNR